MVIQTAASIRHELTRLHSWSVTVNVEATRRAALERVRRERPKVKSANPLIDRTMAIRMRREGLTTDPEPIPLVPTERSTHPEAWPEGACDDAEELSST